MDKKDMYHYIAPSNTNHSIKTRGFFNDISEVKYTIIEHRPDFIHSRFEYPNGVILESKQSSEFIELWTSHKLILNPNLEIVFDIEKEIS